MTMTETRASATPDASDLTIASIEAIRLKLPYKKPISFASLTESTGQYVILRIVLSDGTEGIAESVCRPGHTGEDAIIVAYQIETFFKPLLLGADPFGHLALLSQIEKIRECRAAKMLIDIALWTCAASCSASRSGGSLAAAIPSPCRSPGSRTAIRATRRSRRPGVWWTNAAIAA